jgi:photosystem II stability/assembly factor-like uncharacterized protein
MKIINLLLLFFLIANLCNSQNNWYLVNSNVTSNLNEIIFINSDLKIGYIAGDSGVVLKTIDTGKTWSKQTINPVVNLRKIQFINSQTGWVTGASSIGINVFKTTNGGNYWSEIYNASDAICFPTGIHFINSLTGFITGGNRFSSSLTKGFIIRTINGGNNWTRENWNFDCISGISFKDAENGWMFTWYNIDSHFGELWLTTNHGVNWNSYLNADEFEFSSLFYKTLDLAWSFGKSKLNQNLLMLYEWNGNTWFPKWYDLVNYSYTSMFFYDSLNGVMCSDSGYIKKTSNGGTTLINQNPVIRTNLHSIVMISPMFGFAVGNSGKILSNSIIVGMSNNEENLPIKYYLHQNYPNPFNPITKIKFDIPTLYKGGRGGVSLKVFDITGREIQTLVNSDLKPGTYEITFDGSNLSSGIYFYRLEAGEFRDVKKLVLLK